MLMEEKNVAKIIAVANQKGGVGKTTTSVNLSAGLAMLGKRVLLIDSDPQGNATSGFGINKSDLTTTIYQVLIENLAIEKAVLHTGYEVDVLPANIELAGAEIELVAAISRENRLKRSVDAVREQYDFILIDCPPSLGLLTLNALTAADTVLMPIQCEFYALEGLAQLMNTMTLVQNNLNPALEVEGFLRQPNLSVQVAEEVRTHFGSKVYRTVIPRTVRLSEAPSYGQPIVAYDRNCKGAVVYMDLAKEVAERDS